MKIAKLENSNINFNAGLTNALLLREKLISASSAELRLNNNYGIKADFAGNKSIALANSLCADIFKQLSKMLGKDIPTPPFITVYKKNQLINNDAYMDFCSIGDAFVLKDKSLYPSGSVFFRNYRNLKHLDNFTETMFKKNQTSSNHFLAPVIHEWMHNVHLNIINSESKNQAKQVNIEKIMNNFLSDEECKVVSQELGLYAANKKNQYFEIFSEFFTRLICKSLSKDSRTLLNNPLDLIKYESSEFKKIIQKILNA